MKTCETCAEFRPDVEMQMKIGNCLHLGRPITSFQSRNCDGMGWTKKGDALKHFDLTKEETGRVLTAIDEYFRAYMRAAMKPTHDTGGTIAKPFAVRKGKMRPDQATEKTKGMKFKGVLSGMFISDDGGKTWQPLYRNNKQETNMSEKTELKPGDRVRVGRSGYGSHAATLIGVSQHSRTPYFALLDSGGYGTYTHAEPIPVCEFEPGEMVEVSHVSDFPKSGTHRRKYLRPSEGGHVCEHAEQGAVIPIPWRYCRKFTPWQPKEWEPAAAWSDGDRTITIGYRAKGVPYSHHLVVSKGPIPVEYFARIPDNFDPKNPDHYEVSWWENCGTDIWKP